MTILLMCSGTDRVWAFINSYLVGCKRKSIENNGGM